MNRLLFLLLTLCFSLTLSVSHARQAKGLVTFPEFPDGNGLLLACLQKEIHYTTTALENEIEGYIIVMLKIEEDNTISFDSLPCPPVKQSRLFLV